MLKKIFQIIIRVFLLSIILVLGFTIIFPSWYDNRHIVIDEITSKFMSKDELQFREDAKRNNMPLNEYKAQVLKNKEVTKARKKLAVKLEEAIKAKDDQQLTTLISSAHILHLPLNLYAQVIDQNYSNGIDIIHQNGIQCTARPEQFKDDSKVRDAIYGIQSKTLEAVLTSNTSIFEKWIELDCYKVHASIENKLIHNSNFLSLLENISFKDKDKDFWEKVLRKSISKKKIETAKLLIKKGMILSKNRILAPNKKEINTDFLTALVHQGKFELANEVLKANPRYINENNLDQEILNSLKNNQ